MKKNLPKKEKSVLQGKLTKLAVQIGKAGTNFFFIVLGGAKQYLGTIKIFLNRNVPFIIPYIYVSRYLL